MPYKIDSPPEAIKNLPKHAKEIWISAFNNSYDKYGETRSFKIAWSAVKKMYKQDEKGVWVKIESNTDMSEKIDLDKTGGWFPVFKTGIHIDSNGNTREWTEKDIDNIISKYNPNNHEAPLVIGHPTDNAPAWGWVSGLKRDGEVMFAQGNDIDDSFKDLVNKGQYKKRSISLYPDMTLRHIGFLGAVPPAVKGLPDVQFSDSDTINIDYIDNIGGFEMPEETKKEDVSFREKVSKLFDRFVRQLPENDPSIIIGFSEADVEGMKKEAIEKAITEERERVKLEFAEQQKKAEEEKRSKSINDWFASKTKEGFLPPAWIDGGIKEFVEALNNSTTINFGETKGKPLSKWFMEFIDNLPKVIEFKEVATKGKDVGESGNSSQKMAALINKKMADGKLNFSEAMLKVQEENPELTNQYIDELSQ